MCATLPKFINLARNILVTHTSEFILLLPLVGDEKCCGRASSHVRHRTSHAPVCHERSGLQAGRIVEGPLTAHIGRRSLIQASSPDPVLDHAVVPIGAIPRCAPHGSGTSPVEPKYAR